MLILYDNFILERQIRENNLDKNILLAISFIRYFNNKLALQQLKYLKYIIKNLKQRFKND